MFAVRGWHSYRENSIVPTDVLSEMECQMVVGCPVSKFVRRLYYIFIYACAFQALVTSVICYSLAHFVNVSVEKKIPPCIHLFRQGKWDSLVGHLRVFFKIPPMEWLYKLVEVSSRRVKAFLKSWFKISKLMDSAWKKENQKWGRIVRFVSSKHFRSGQFVCNFSISRPNCLVWFIHLAWYKVHICQAEGFTAGEFPQTGAVSVHFRCCKESSAISPPCPCHHLLPWTLVPCSKGKQSTNGYSPCIFHPERCSKRSMFHLGGSNWRGASCS